MWQIIAEWVNCSQMEAIPCFACYSIAKLPSCNIDLFIIRNFITTLKKVATFFFDLADVSSIYYSLSFFVFFFHVGHQIAFVTHPSSASLPSFIRKIELQKTKSHNNSFYFYLKKIGRYGTTAHFYVVYAEIIIIMMCHNRKHIREKKSFGWFFLVCRFFFIGCFETNFIDDTYAASTNVQFKLIWVLVTHIFLGSKYGFAYKAHDNMDMKLFNQTLLFNIRLSHIYGSMSKMLVRQTKIRVEIYFANNDECVYEPLWWCMGMSRFPGPGANV